MFTVSGLGIDGGLDKTLITSNPVESMISIARTTNRNVTRWRDGHMVLGCTAAGMLNAKRSFRRIKGYKQMPQMVAALHRHAHPNTMARTHESVGTAVWSSARIATQDLRYSGHPQHTASPTTGLGGPRRRFISMVLLAVGQTACAGRTRGCCARTKAGSRTEFVPGSWPRLRAS